MKNLRVMITQPYFGYGKNLREEHLESERQRVTKTHLPEVYTDTVGEDHYYKAQSWKLIYRGNRS